MGFPTTGGAFSLLSKVIQLTLGARARVRTRIRTFARVFIVVRVPI